MKAARLVGPKKFEFLEVEQPVPDDGQCLIKLERISVCGSDIRNIYGPDHPEEDYPMPVGRPCHELAGVVVESRTDSYHEGQRVIAIAYPGTGGLCEYILSDPDRMVLLPDEGPLDEWVMCQPSGTVLYSCQQMPNILGKNVVIMGQGSSNTKLHLRIVGFDQGRTFRGLKTRSERASLGNLLNIWSTTTHTSCGRAVLEIDRIYPSSLKVAVRIDHGSTIGTDPLGKLLVGD